MSVLTKSHTQEVAKTLLGVLLRSVCCEFSDEVSTVCLCEGQEYNHGTSDPTAFCRDYLVNPHNHSKQFLLGHHYSPFYSSQVVEFLQAKNSEPAVPRL